MSDPPFFLFFFLFPPSPFPGLSFCSVRINEKLNAILKIGQMRALSFLSFLSFLFFPSFFVLALRQRAALDENMEGSTNGKRDSFPSLFYA